MSMSKMDTSVFGNSKNYAILWYNIHLQGLYATTEERKKVYVHSIEMLQANFMCEHCKGHFGKWLETNPLKNYWNIKDKNGADIGFFRWSWEFHDAVNARLSKVRPSYEQAYEFFSSEKTACKECGTPDIAPADKEVSLKVIKAVQTVRSKKNTPNEYVIHKIKLYKVATNTNLSPANRVISRS